MLKRIMAGLLTLVLVLTGPGVAEVAYAAGNTAPISSESSQSVSLEPEVVGNGSVGTLLAEEVNQAAEEEEALAQSNCAVTDITMEGNVASVSLHIEQSAMLIVGVYDENGQWMLASGKSEVTEACSEVAVTIETETMPEYFCLKAYLVDSLTMRPLSEVYENYLYTYEMQEFLEKTTDDFEAEKVVKMEESDENNFVVFADEVIQTSESETQNKLEITGTTYVFSAADSTILSLQVGNLVAYTRMDGTKEAFKVGSICVDGTTVTIETEDSSADEMFSYVKIDTYSQGSDAAQSFSLLGESIDEILPFYIPIEEGGEDDDHYSMNGSLGLWVHFQYYKTGNKPDYVKFKIDYNLNLEVAVYTAWDKDIPLPEAHIPLSANLLEVKIAPYFQLEASAKLKADVWMSGVVGFDVRPKINQGNNLTEGPYVVIEGIEGNVELAVSFHFVPSLVALDLHVVEGLEVGVDVSIGLKAAAALKKSEANHECNKCVDGDVYLTGGIDLFAKFLGEDIMEPLEIAFPDRKMWDFYFSVDHSEFGFDATCPYISPYGDYVLYLKVVDEKGNPLSGVSVKVGTTDMTTDSEGIIKEGTNSADKLTVTLSKTSYETKTVRVTPVALRGGVPGKVVLYLKVQTTPKPTPRPTVMPTARPTATPTPTPTATVAPTVIPTATPTPTSIPTPTPSYTLEYMEDDNGNITITGYTGVAKGDLIIPEQIDGKIVTAIGNFAFEDCSGFTGELVLPESLTSIGTYAFSNCSGFTGDLVFPESLTSIGIGVFSGCSGFTGELVLPESLTAIGTYAFFNCSGFTGELVLPESLTAIGIYAFSGCSGFTGELILPESLTVIDEFTFSGCSGFTGELILPESLTVIGNSAFYGCNGLMGELVLPESLTMIGSDAFRDCSGLTGELVLPESLTSIGSYAFGDCSGLTGELVLPESLTSIGNGAFSGCSGFTGDLVLPESLTSIGNGAFSGCSGFTGDLVLPENLTAIDSNTFSGCNGFTGELVLPESLTSIGSYAFKGCSGFTGELILPESLTSIGYATFSGCSGFTGDLVLPESLTSIGYYAFYGCNGFTGELVLPEILTAISDYAFSGCGFKRLQLPKSLTYVGQEAFWFIGENDVYYAGTLEELSYIIGSYGYAINDCFNGTIHYESAIPAGNQEISSINEELQGSTEIVEAPIYQSAPTNSEIQLLSVAVNPLKNPVLSEDETNPAIRTATFTDLTANETYNLYALLDSGAEDVFASDNLLYMEQVTADGAGNVTVTYRMTQDYPDVIPFLVGYSRSDISDAKVDAANLVYNKDTQYVTLTVIWNGITLTEGSDYYLTGSYAATDIGTYTVNVCGTGLYKGAVAKTYEVYCEHHEVTDARVEPTYTTTGLTEGSHCDICSTVLVAQETIPMLTETPAPTETPTPTATPAPTAMPTATPTPEEQTKQQVEAFVARMYTVALGREAEEAGLKYWTDELLAHEIDGAGIAYNFIMSSEFIGKDLDDEEFVDTLYKTFFNREVDEGGRNFWMKELASGQIRGYVLAGFVNSPEFDELCVAYGISRGIMRADGTAVNPGIRSFVERCYNKVLEREGEKAGVDNWTNRIANGIQTAEDVAKLFFFSEEYIQKNTSNDVFVETLYQTFMGRASDEAGKEYWLKRLSAGTNRNEVLEGFSKSLEFSEILASYGL